MIKKNITVSQTQSESAQKEPAFWRHFSFLTENSVHDSFSNLKRFSRIPQYNVVVM